MPQTRSMAALVFAIGVSTAGCGEDAAPDLDWDPLINSKALPEAPALPELEQVDEGELTGVWLTIGEYGAHETLLLRRDGCFEYAQEQSNFDGEHGVIDRSHTRCGACLPEAQAEALIAPFLPLDDQAEFPSPEAEDVESPPPAWIRLGDGVSAPHANQPLRGFVELSRQGNPNRGWLTGEPNEELAPAILEAREVIRNFSDSAREERCAKPFSTE